MEVVLARLQDFTCKTTTFAGGASAGQSTCRVPQTQRIHLREGLSTGGFAHRQETTYNLGIESALAWLRRELMEMRSQDQALIRQLMNLHWGIQDLKQELSEKNEQGEEEEGSTWDSEEESESVYFSLGEKGLNLSCGQMAPPLTLRPGAKRVFSRRRSVP